MRQINQNILKIKDPTTGEFKTIPNLMLDNNPEKISGVEVGTTEPTDIYTDVWIDTNEDVSYKIPQIDDNAVNTVDTWSSMKISREIDGSVAVVDNKVDTEIENVNNKISNAISYSTEGTLTGGIWIDGKPIYRVVLKSDKIDLNSTKTFLLGISSSELDTIVSYSGICYTNNGSWVSLPYGSDDSNITVTIPHTTSGGLFVRLETKDTWVIERAYIIVEYTKISA